MTAGDSVARACEWCGRPSHTATCSSCSRLRRCECGRTYSSQRGSSLGCDRCRQIDGATLGVFAVIQAIRASSEPPTRLEIAADAPAPATNVTHILLRLRQRGRVRALIPPEGGAYRYRLCDLRELAQ